MLNKFLQNVNPLLRTLPHKETPGTWGMLAQDYVNNLLGYGKTGIMDAKWNAAADKFNMFLADKGIDHTIPMYLPKDFAHLWRDALYRGALGPDTAIRNLTKLLYLMADKGPMPFLKSMVNAFEAWNKETPEWAKFKEHMDIIGDTWWKDMANLKRDNPGAWKKAKDASSTITRWALAPIRFTEHISKAMAYFAALEKGIKDGVDFETQHLVGMS
jgi:hypothetical protein